MEIAIFQFSLFGINTYVVFDKISKECVVVDPGILTKEEENVMSEFIEKNGLSVTNVVNTHLHLDHAVGNSFIKDRYKVPVLANEKDMPLGERMQQQADMFGLRGSFDGAGVTGFLYEGDEITVGTGKLKVIEVPGHSRGSIALYDEKDGFVITGDALFNGSIGRTDLPGGDYNTLISSIKQKLMILPDSTIVYPGHGPATTIANEKAMNPYLS